MIILLIHLMLSQFSQPSPYNLNTICLHPHMPLVVDNTNPNPTVN
jgi:hypothetical protein